MVETAAPSSERRTVRIPGTATKVCLLVAALLVVAAAYFALTPLMVMTTSGNGWNCGTALNPPTDAFGSGLCGQLNAAYLAKAVAAGTAAVVTAVGGFLLFGSVQRVEHRRTSHEYPVGAN